MFGCPEFATSRGRSVLAEPRIIPLDEAPDPGLRGVPLRPRLVAREACYNLTRMLDLRDIPTCLCVDCGADLSRVATFARFCPNCGVKLADFHAARAAIDSPLERAANLILRGYANAMCRLGEHYEVRHHDEEAARCYGKASRLGNGLAKARLIDIPLAKVIEAKHSFQNRRRV